MKLKKLFSTNETILLGLRENDEDVFRFIYKECFPIIRSLILKNSGSEDDAKDVMQESTIIFYEKAVHNKDFVLTCDFKTYLYSVSRNYWLKELRRIGKFAGLVETEFSYIPIEDEKEKSIDKDEKITIIEQAINILGERCKKILQFYYYNKMSMKEIAYKLNYTNEVNARTQKYKCLQMLKRSAGKMLK